MTQIVWTETALLQLVEAVIRVEGEMMSEKMRERRRSAGNGQGKWNRVADLLPPELGVRTWNSQRGMYDAPKCRRRFSTLVVTYKDQLEGRNTKASRLQLAESVKRILKRRDDLLNYTGSSIPSATSLRSERSHCDLEQLVSNSTSDSSKGQDSSSPETEESLKRGIVKNRKIIWTDTARIQVIEAVIKVKEKMTSESNKGIQHSACTGMTICNWKMVAELLPAELRGTTWDRKQQMPRYKCCRIFYRLVLAYRHQVAGKCTRRSERVLTKPMLKLLKRHEEIASARCSASERASQAETSYKPENSKSCDTTKISHRDEQQLSPNSSKSSTQAQSMTSARPHEGAACSTKDTYELDSARKVRHFEKEVDKEEKTDASHGESSEKHTSDPTGVSRSAAEAQHPEFSASWNSAQNPAPRRPKTQAQRREQVQETDCATMQPSKRKWNVLKTNPSCDQEELQRTMERSLKRIYFEFSDFSSWVHNRLSPVRQSVLNQLVQSNLKGMIEEQIEILFSELRIRLVQQVQNASLDLAEKILDIFSTVFQVHEVHHVAQPKKRHRCHRRS